LLALGQLFITGEQMPVLRNLFGVLNSCCGLSAQDRRQHAGRLGENLTLKYLRRKGYKLVCRNWRCRAGELDIVMQDGIEVVFVEVKTRCSNEDHYYLFDSLTEAKLRTLELLADLFLRKRLARGLTVRFRIDAVGVLLDGAGVKLRHIEHLRSIV
jgi:putative endonuclease